LLSSKYILSIKNPSYSDLKKTLADALARIENLTKEFESMRQELNSAKIEISTLKTELAIYKNPKNSNNSSIPPSKDENRVKKNQSLREKSGKKSGGQPGHQGNTLAMVSVPDQIIRHLPQICDHCGKDLSSIEPVFAGKRQVIEIPPIKPVYVQHETYQRQCSCGKVCEGSFPGHLKAPVQYGDSVANLVSYFSARHYLPFQRSCEIFGHVFNIPISEGSIANLVQATADKLYPYYLQIKGRVENSNALGADETGAKINGKKGWFWTWQDRLHTFIAVSMSRGEKVREEHFLKGFPDAILNSDAYPVHLSTPCKGHQLCIAHLLRELNYFIEIYPCNQWPQKLKALFKDALGLKANMATQDYDHCPKRDKLSKTLNGLLKNPPAPKGKLLAFYKRMVKNQKSLFTFLYYPEVSPDNNASERGIRNVKVKQKVSGQFKSMAGAQNFAIIRSVIDTYIKKNLKILESLSKLPNLAPE